VAVQLNNGVTDEYLRLLNTATPISTGATDSWSMGLWLYRDTDKATNEYIALMTTDAVGTATSGNGLRISSSDALQATTNGAGTAIQTPQPLATWTYAAVTFGNGSGTSYYGTSTTLAAGSGGGRANVADVLDTLIVGRSVVTSPINVFSGRVDHLRLWTGALSQAEFEAEMVSATAIKTSGLWAAYEFPNSDSGGAFLQDYSGNGRNVSGIGVTHAGNYIAGPTLGGSTQSNAPRAHLLRMLRTA
jgi:hypothetical protein